MTAEQKAAYIIAQSVAASAEIEGMKAENARSIANGVSIAYGEDAFTEVIEKYGLHHNAVIGFFHE